MSPSRIPAAALRVDASLAPDDARRWAPFAGTRALGSLLFGTRTLAARLAEAVAEGEEQPEGGAAAGNGLPPRSGSLSDSPSDSLPLDLSLRLDPRLVPEGPIPMAALRRALAEQSGGPGGAGLALVTPDGAEVGEARLVPHAPDASSAPHGDPQSNPAGSALPPGDLPRFEIPGFRLHSPWELMHRNGDWITRDLLASTPKDALPLTDLPPGVHVLGSAPVTVGAGVRLDPQVVLDARQGPIHLAEGVEIQGFTRLEGPAWIGAGSRLQGGVFSAVTVGPVCRLRGEIADSVLNGWCNKAHDGYLGHAVLGRWVNLGAFTTNSDLKNTYGPVRVPLSATDTEDSGLLKVGVLLGDHVKTGIGTLLNTGTVVGAGSTLFAGGGLPPRWVPPFSWGSGPELVPVRLEAFLEVAGRAMARRDRSLTPEERAALVALWSATHAQGSPE